MLKYVGIGLGGIVGLALVFLFVLSLEDMSFKYKAYEACTKSGYLQIDGYAFKCTLLEVENGN